ncbi:serine protease [Arthrobacter crystallopoietes BAB-32]|uniref:Serine protease n=1 Tax=Arthrobacter crystallopoietes BAB-32 TaxID=1246476 RepID=N1V317_9MICC|nr:S8 family peptidase [Arthrobacter crystallopoietes]EMY34389.1 serine protease [Arthrobacter crystallopoietes BAB-32]
MSVLRLPRLFSGAAVLCAAVLAGGLVAVPVEAAGKVLPVAAEEAAPAVLTGAGNDDGGPAAGRFIVKFKERAVRSSAGRSRAYGLTAKALRVSVEEIRRTATGAHVVAVDEPLDGEQAERLVSALEASPDVVYVEPDRLMQPAALAPDDALYGQQWNLKEERAGMRVPGAWDVSTGDGAVVAIVDTGITEHSDLAGKVLPGYDMIADVEMARDGNGRDADARDEGDWYGDGECGADAGGGNSSWHGTHVAGTVAAVTGNGKGVAGIAPDAQILPVRVLGACGGFTSDISDAIIWAAGGDVAGTPVNPYPAQVINLSLGGGWRCSATTQEAINYAVSAGAAVVAAAGNEGIDAAESSPANCNNVIAVGASARDGKRAHYSNYGSRIDVMAPGGDMAAAQANGIVSTSNAGETGPGAEQYAHAEGTSMAAPHVAGVAALLMSPAGGGLSPADVEKRLKATARPLATACSLGCGAGLVDATAALTGAVPATQPATPSIRPGDLVAFDREGQLWNYGKSGSSATRKLIGRSGWTTMDEIHTADWNDDGYVDIIAKTKAGQLYFYKAARTGGFSRSLIGGSGWAPLDLTVTRWRSGDEYPSILAKDTRNGRLYVYGNASGSTLSSRYVLGSSGWADYVLTAMDWDKDGRRDIVAKTPAGQLKLYRGDGTGGFASGFRMIIGSSGWNGMRNIVSSNGFGGTGTNGLFARDSKGTLWYYQANRSSWAKRTLVGTGWSSYHVAGQ